MLKFSPPLLHSGKRDWDKNVQDWNLNWISCTVKRNTWLLSRSKFRRSKKCEQLNRIGTEECKSVWRRWGQPSETFSVVSIFRSHVTSWQLWSYMGLLGPAWCKLFSVILLHLFHSTCFGCNIHPSSGAIYNVHADGSWNLDTSWNRSTYTCTYLYHLHVHYISVLRMDVYYNRNM